MRNNITIVRRSLKMSETDLAAVTGLDRTYLNRVTHCDQMPGLINAYKIARALRCSIDELFIIEEKDLEKGE